MAKNLKQQLNSFDSRPKPKILSPADSKFAEKRHTTANLMPSTILNQNITVENITIANMNINMIESTEISKAQTQ